MEEKGRGPDVALKPAHTSSQKSINIFSEIMHAGC